MKFRRSLSASLLCILLSQTISFGGGLLGVCAETASKICRCNHGSKKEIHTNAEDALFKSSQTKKKWNTLVSKETIQSKTCHTADSNSAHICSCKKKKNSLARLSIYYQTWISSFAFISLHIRVISESSILTSSGLVLEEWNWKLIKPPRLT